MRVTYNWLKDFVDIRISPQALAEKLTMAGLEVTSLEARDGDFILEMEITSNRPDWLSVAGIAREAAAVTGSKIKGTGKSQVKHKNLKLAPCALQSLQIEIEDKKDCPLYTAKIIRGVKVGASPDWLKERLELIGCRSVNNVVDITNYILFSFGEPLHAFDLDRLGGSSIMVRRARSGEKLTTIDGAYRTLDSGILVIANQERPVAIAGIMGGQQSEVISSTKNILLEAAVFNPIVVRRARQKLGLQSESSYRFERGVDAKTAQTASWQAVGLIRELCAGTCVLSKEAGTAPAAKKVIALDTRRSNEILGTRIPAQGIKNILSRLGFQVKPRGKNNFQVAVPPQRQDVGLEIDLVEEIARIYGYAQIPATLPKMSPGIGASGSRGLVALVKNILAGLGLQEVITYSLVDRDSLRDLALPTAPLEILNPLSQEQEVLRPSVLGGLLKCLALNFNRKQELVNIFEIAPVFGGSTQQPREELSLGIALGGVKSALVGEQGLVKETVGALHLKGILEILFSRLGIANYSLEPLQGAAEFAVCVAGEKIGRLLQPSRGLLERFEIKNKEVVLLELALEKVFSGVKLEKKYSPLPVYPGITRDISFILKENIRAAEIFKAIKERGGSLLEEARIVDYYQGSQIPAGFRGLTISCFYRLSGRTLTEAEVNPVHTLVLAVLKDRFGAQFR
jgi:phenylalanyl-tRNA synthetase beta chain